MSVFLRHHYFQMALQRFAILVSRILHLVHKELHISLLSLCCLADTCLVAGFYLFYAVNPLP